MLRIATRGSALALWQARHVASLLRDACGLDVEEVVISTAGDRNRDVPISAIGGRGVFTKEVQAAVLDGRADVAVHSAKDLPSSAELQPDGLVLACIPERADARDALVGSTLDGLAPGATIATGSVRRRAQLADRRPDLTFAELRGNMDTRVSKVPDGGAVVVALAALRRLGWEDRIAEVLPTTVVLPQVGQGALAIECREDDDATRAALAAIEHDVTRRCVDLERAWLATLGGGCDLPAGAHCTPDGRLRAVLASFDGRIVLRDETSDGDAAALARRMLGGGGAHLLAEAGIER